MPRLEVDPNLCQGHARCFVLAPETFRLDDEGYSHVIEGREQSFNEENVIKAIKNCPERAIRVVDTDG
jgi:ferredoxin